MFDNTFIDYSTGNQMIPTERVISVNESCGCFGR